MTNISLICSTYNSPQFLEIVLESIGGQTFTDFELLIADDGSGEETANVITAFKERARFPVEHLWQEDRGFLKSRIHNQAIRQSKGELLVFIDGDCILAPDFLKDHLAAHENSNSDKSVFMGRRVDLGPELTDRINKDNFKQVLFSKFVSFPLLKSHFKSDTNYMLRKFSFKNPLVRKVFRADNVPDLIGCNFSLSRDLMFEINGFNENFEGYGLEDFDIFIRLKNLGCEMMGKKYCAVQFHLYHPRSENTRENIEIYEAKLRNTGYVHAANGLEKD